MKALILLLTGAAVALAAPPAGGSDIHLNDKEYFEAPGLAFLLFHNNYEVGFQGGLQMILHGERVLDSGDLYTVSRNGTSSRGFRVMRREVSGDGVATVYGDANGDPYRLITRADGHRISVTLRLDKPIDWTKFREAGLRFYIYPGSYYFKAYESGPTAGTFTRQYSGKPVLAGPAETISIAPGDPLASIRFSSKVPNLVLRDDRGQGRISTWFAVTAPLKPGSQQTEVSMDLTPGIDPQWRATPVIGFSQVGYHPGQIKRAVLELDSRDELSAPVTLYRLAEGGRQKVKSAAPSKWGGRFLSKQYAYFDFTDTRTPGMYTIEYRGQMAGPFRIGAEVWREAWEPTLQYFFPIQMCHVKVRESSKTWHGACHLDDAQQAPENMPYIDGYQQGKRETRFADNEHIPGLDWGGWHDAGDHDLAAGSFAQTTLALALAQEEFRPNLDLTSINRATREVLLGVPDQRSDLLQQIEYGVEGMLASYRTGGHVFPGIIERTSLGYGHMGDPVNITDNQVNSPAGAPDDRWVFTNRNTGLQYKVAQSLTAAARVFPGYNDKLAAECLQTARKLWDYEQAHPPVYARNAYVPQDSGKRVEEIAATAELLLTDNREAYAVRLAALVPEIRSMTPEQFAQGPGWTLVRALPKIGNGELASAIREQSANWAKAAKALGALNPYGVRLPRWASQPEWKLEERTGIHSNFVWGRGWDLQRDAMAQYYFHKQMPDQFDAEPLLAVVNFVLGCHPASNRSYVTGVGANSAIVAYGTNRADWTGIPGGVISGVSLIKPDFMELKEFPYLWYQTEYVLGGGATYIFDVLAADHLLSR